MHILIIKIGALGDVLRTSYFCKSLKEKNAVACENFKIWFYTSKTAVNLLKNNPNIDYLLSDIEEITENEFDVVYSLEDNKELVGLTNRVKYKQLVGAFITKNSIVKYTPEVKEYYDMGLISCFGVKRANELKKLNKQSHCEIFRKIFDVKNIYREIYGEDKNPIIHDLKNNEFNAAILNPFAGRRWPSKSLNLNVVKDLISQLLAEHNKRSIFLTTGPENKDKYDLLTESFKNEPRLKLVNPEKGIMEIAKIIQQCDYMLSVDSLLLHISICIGIPTVAVFTSTSANEIPDAANLVKLTSISEKYCSYKKFDDYEDINAQSIMNSIRKIC